MYDELVRNLLEVSTWYHIILEIVGKCNMQIDLNQINYYNKKRNKHQTKCLFTFIWFDIGLITLVII